MHTTNFTQQLTVHFNMLYCVNKMTLSSNHQPIFIQSITNFSFLISVSFSTLDEIYFHISAVEKLVSIPRFHVTIRHLKADINSVFM